MGSPISANNWNYHREADTYPFGVTFPWEADPGLFRGWQDKVLAAGERHKIYRIDEHEVLGYRRERDGDLIPFLTEHADRVPPFLELPEGMVLQYFSTEPVASTYLHYVDPKDGNICGRWVNNMYDLAKDLGIPGSAYPVPPIYMFIDVNSREEDGDEFMSLTVSTSTDIWFPWNRRGHRRGYTRQEPIDNRVLSRLNGTRLNAFLRDLKKATADAGGTWDPVEWGRTGYVMADQNGVLLDAPRPSSLAP